MILSGTERFQVMVTWGIVSILIKSLEESTFAKLTPSHPVVNVSSSSSLKVAWGKSTGYADDLREQGWDTQRAQQLENWHSQQEVLASRKAQRAMTDDFDNVSTPDEDWRKLASFGVERNEVRLF